MTVLATANIHLNFHLHLHLNIHPHPRLSGRTYTLAPPPLAMLTSPSPPTDMVNWYA